MDNFELIANLVPIIMFVFLMLLGYGVGSTVEKRHFRRLEERETITRGTPVTNMDDPPESPSDVVRANLVTGSAVISVDYFKRMLSGLQNLVGGRVSAYESLMDRARREAVLRMMESAADADEFLNVRIETSQIGSKINKKNRTACLEALAYGTAVWLKK